MPANDATRKARQKAVEAAYADGFDPPTANQRNNSAIYEAAKRLKGATGSTLHTWWHFEKRTKAAGHKHFFPDETKHKPRPVEIGEGQPDDPSQLLFLRDRVKRLERERDDALRAAGAAGTFRSSVLGLMDDMPEPTEFAVSKSSSKHAPETIVLMATDWQWGETVNLGRMDGLNSYNREIATRRAERMFTTAISLATEHWAGPPPARMLLILGGDMISGEIHDELAKTNELLAIPALKDCAGALMGGIDLLLSELDCPIDVINLPGNHGRVTRKPESKLYAETSYDTLLGDILDLHYRGNPRVTFYAPQSGDALFTIDGWTFLATHGDRIGSRGGAGFVGAAATVARGFKRLIGDYAARGVMLDNILCGHFHTSLRLEEGFVSGTLVGPSEYSRDGRFRPRPASQLFLAVHPSRGVTQVREIYVGAPEEGSLYQGKSGGVVERPRYRVPAIGKLAS